MKKFIMTLALALLVVGTLICLSACESRKTVYEDREILKIEMIWREGFAPFPREFVRTFDFESGKVTDTWKADEEYLDNDNRKEYNRPKTIAKFTEEQGQTLIDKIGALGFFDWAESYITDETIYDAGSSRVKVYFADGTEKSTVIYCMNPPNYEQIRKAIEEIFGVTMYLEF